MLFIFNIALIARCIKITVDPYGSIHDYIGVGSYTSVTPLQRYAWKRQDFYQKQIFITVILQVNQKYRMAVSFW